MNFTLMERKLSTYQYFEILQVEWLVADLRCRIYSDDKDRTYWNKVREGKKAKINNIADKNRLPTIFTDEELKRDLENRIFNDYSYPNFHYKDENQKKSQGYWDLLHYYSKDTEVRYELLGEVKVGKVVDYTPFDHEIRIQCIHSSNIEIAPVSKTVRIL